MYKDIKGYHKVLVGFFVLALVLAVGWQIVNGRTYHPDTGINLVVVGENEVVVVGVSKNEDSLMWVELPSNLRIDSYPIVSIWGLGEIEGESEKMMKTKMGEGFGLWFQAVLKVEGDLTMDGLLRRLLSFKKIEGLNWLDRYTLYKDMSGLAVRGVVLEVNLPHQVTNKLQDIDGYEWLELNEAVFVWSKDLWPREDVMNLGVTAEVINVSDVPGKARKRARQLESVGFRVVGVEAREIDQDKECVVKINPKMEEKIELLKELFESYLGCEISKFNEADKYFGDVVFLVGS
jgi:hypothetical protein